jgi:uncharacterized membrane protein
MRVTSKRLNIFGRSHPYNIGYLCTSFTLIYCQSERSITQMLKKKFPLTRLQTFVAILLLLGILFRFINLDGKLYWYDETLTSLRISGQTQTELVQEVFNGRVITVKELQQKYQYPNREKGLNDAIKAFAGNAEHSPLYYLMARFWVQVLGNSVTVIRSLSAIISLLALPCIYWLCLELFESALTGWLAVVRTAGTAI